MKLFFFDRETGGLEWWPTQDCSIRPITQFAGIIYDTETRKTVAEMEMKIAFNKEHATEQALEINHYSEEAWNHAVPEKDAAEKILSFIRAHRYTMLQSKRTGKPYSVATPAGHNAAKFDVPFLHAWLKHRLGEKTFVPMDYHAVDTCALAILAEHLTGTTFTNKKLETLARKLGCPIADGEAHDAFVDVRATINVYNALIKYIDNHYREGGRDDLLGF